MLSAAATVHDNVADADVTWHCAYTPPGTGTIAQTTTVYRLSFESRKAPKLDIGKSRASGQKLPSQQNVLINDVVVVFGVRYSSRGAFESVSEKVSTHADFNNDVVTTTRASLVVYFVPAGWPAAQVFANRSGW